MKLGVLALDYDGTIATDGVLETTVQDALLGLREQGVAVLLVTGRILADLERLLPDPCAFDAIVAENGAVLHFPASARSLELADPPPPELLAELRRRGVPFLAGETVVETSADNAAVVLTVVRDLELPLVLAFNRGRVMVLPQAVSKASGLREAARALRLSLHNAVGIGDAENDHQLLAVCELGVAVSWGSRKLREVADEVLEGEGPPAVAEYVRRLGADPRLPPERIGRRSLHLGIREGGESLALAVRGRNVLIAGDTRSGKSWVAGLLCEQLVLQHYCVCVVDPEGEYAAIETLPSVVVYDADPRPPDLDDLERTLRYPDVSVVVDLSAMPRGEKPRYVRSLLRRLEDLRHRTGLPHRIVVDEAHYFLHSSDAAEVVDLSLGGYTLVTYRASLLDRAVLASAGAVIVTRVTSPRESKALHALRGGGADEGLWRRTLAGLRLDQAVLLPGAEEARGELARFRISGRLTAHVRHRRKYLSVPVPPERAFVFRRGGEPTGREALTLDQFAAVLACEPPFEEHLAAHDFSTWIRTVFSDVELASRVRRVEDEWLAGRTDAPHGAVIAVVDERYR